MTEDPKVSNMLFIVMYISFLGDWSNLLFPNAYMHTHCICETRLFLYRNNPGLLGRRTSKLMSNQFVTSIVIGTSLMEHSHVWSS